jgi:hypothetical protein
MSVTETRTTAMYLITTTADNNGLTYRAAPFGDTGDYIGRQVTRLKNGTYSQTGCSKRLTVILANWIASASDLDDA